MNNPLAEPQREKSGSNTLTKYFYQYHWALYELLNKHQQGKEYIAFMEVHEDVVFSNSLNNDGTFEFYQVKNTTPKTLEAILKIPGKKKNSIIGKCVLSVHKKSYKDKVKTINLVVSQGFNMGKHLNENFKLNKISTSNLKNDSLTMLSEAIRLEIGEEVDISLLNFINSDLYSDYESMEQKVIGFIAQISSSIFPGLPHNSSDSYLLLIDTLQRKGVCDYDFTDWQEFVKHKGLTSEQVDLVLKRNTADGFREIREVFDDISSDLGIKSFKKTSYKNALERLHTDIKFNKARHIMYAVESINEYLSSQNFKLDEISPVILESVQRDVKIIGVDVYIATIYCIIQRVLNYEEPMELQAIS